jgi:hypothetical protein
MHGAAGRVNPVKLVAAPAVILRGLPATVAAGAVERGELEQFYDLPIIQ